MSSDQEVTRSVQLWLQDGATVLPDRVLDQVLAELPSTPQRRRPWQAWRSTPMSKVLKIGLAGAAALVIAVAVIAPLATRRSNVGQPWPTRNRLPVISGTVVLKTGVKEVENGRVVACRGTGANADVAAGTLILVHEKRSDAVIASSRLLMSPEQPVRGCRLSYAIPDVPDAAMYSIRIEGRPFGLTYTPGSLEAAGWVAQPMELE